MVIMGYINLFKLLRTAVLSYNNIILETFVPDFCKIVDFREFISVVDRKALRPRF